MKIEWSIDAMEQVQMLIKGKKGVVKLIYDTEDCDCGNDGVSTLWYISEPEGNESTIETNFGPILVDEDKAIYLSEQMKITWVPELGSFRLSSPEGIINPVMKFYNWVK